jgi:predicted O-linked N-acetylglucosamine transferase (SPINDLY family)
VYKDLGNHQSAANSFRKAYRLSAKPMRKLDTPQRDDRHLKEERMKFLALAVEQSNKACDWRRLRELLPPLVKRLQAGDAAALRATDPYESLLYINSAATSLRVAKQHVDDTRHGDGDAVIQATQYGDWLNLATILRIGVLSADMRHHPVAQTLLGVLESIRAHTGSSDANQRVHIVVFSMCPAKPEDKVQQAIRSQVNGWHDIHAATDEMAAQTIADEGIHVLLEMQGHTMHRRVGIALRHPAPVAISMQGFPASTGMSAPTLPYLLADRVVLPPELATREFVTEELIYMPFAFIACGYQRSVAVPQPALHRSERSEQSDWANRGGTEQGKTTAPRIRTQRGSVPATAYDSVHASVPVPGHRSWVDVDSAWDQELNQLRLDAIVNQLNDFLTLHPSLASTSELREAGLSMTLADTSLQVGASNDNTQQPSVVEHSRMLRLCANNRAAKVDATTMTLWTNVLRRVHQQRKGQLWMDGQFHDAKINLLLEAAARGVADGVEAGRDSTYEDYMRRLGQCELFLDTLSYGAHTVGLDALYMGLPIVTVAGEQMANRVGASLMTAVGSGLYVEPSLKAYEDAAVAHSTDTSISTSIDTSSQPRSEEKQHWRSNDRLSRRHQHRLPKSSRSSPLFDESTFASDLVTAMQRAWKEHKVSSR